MFPILLLSFGLFDHLFEFYFSDSLDFLALKEFEFNWNSDIEFSLPVLGDHVLFVFKARLDESLELFEIFFFKFLLTLEINLRETLLGHSKELYFLFCRADINIVVTLKSATSAEMSQKL
jgi:hypothetical protein